MQHQDIDALIFAIITKHVPHEKKTRSLQRARLSRLSTSEGLQQHFSLSKTPKAELMKMV